MNAAPISRSKLAPLLEPVHAFLQAELAGGIVLMVSVVFALAWANSPWGHSYHAFWHSKLSIGFGASAFAMSLEHWVNDGLMVVFFLLVGLEIKRELLIGELASIQKAALPIAAAIGGMAVPALLFTTINLNGPGSHGWGIPMATDIAFAVGVLALVGRGVPTSVKVFLLAVAIVDDLGAVLVIALFYTGQISTYALGIAALFLAALILLNVLRVHQVWPYLLLGIGLWMATLASGIHATIAGVLLAFTIPATRQIEEQPYLDYVRKMLGRFEQEMLIDPGKITDEQSHALKAMEEASQAVQTPLARVEHSLLKPANFLIIPIFALANGGVVLGGSTGSVAVDPVLWGVLVGLLVGKPLGVLLASLLAIKFKIAKLPSGATYQQIAGIAVLCGIGFTMSLFVTNLAFPGEDSHIAAAKVGILAASLLAGIIGGAILVSARTTPRPT